MADTAPTTPAEATTPKKGAKKAAKKTDRPKTSHPATGVMVNAAIKELKERGGSSLQAIKKYITSTYKIDAEKMSPYIKKYLKSAVSSGALVQTKGKGASGSFKLPTSEKPKGKPKTKKATKAAAKPKAAKPTTPKKAAPKKVAKPTKSAKKAVSPKVAKPKSSSKMKKTAKPPTKKPKASKPKTTKAKSAKKASPKKK